MTNEEALKHFKSLQKRYTTQHNGVMCEKVKIAIEAIEKAIAKKPVEYHLGGVAPFMFGTGKCPSCDEGCNSDMRYCDKCGQKLRWFND